MSDVSDRARQIAAWIKSDSIRWELLGYVRELGLPDCWIAAGFIRNAVWSILHNRNPEISGDVDVVWFKKHDSSEARDLGVESRLRLLAPAIDWSVKNQARMHLKNGDEPYASSEDAMRYWPETATAVGVRRTIEDNCELIAPFGLEDLLGLTLRPAGAFATRKRGVFDARVLEKGWLRDFPMLQQIG